MTPDASARQAARARGRRAESLAALWLRCKGYRVVARGYCVRGGEIDVIARRGATLAFIEVKHRAAHGTAAEAITAAKRRRILIAARHWLAAHPAHARLAARFDAVLVAPGRLPVHVADAWRE